MAAFIVSYRKDTEDKFASANIVWADDYEQVAKEFDDCDWFSGHIAPEWEVKANRAKGMPERWLHT